MNHPQVVSAAEWQAARERLLVKAKELTRRRDAVAAERRRLPMVRVEKDYVFEGPDGKVNLRDLFGGRRQLIVTASSSNRESRAGPRRAARAAPCSPTTSATSFSLTCTLATPPWC